MSGPLGAPGSGGTSSGRGCARAPRGHAGGQNPSESASPEASVCGASCGLSAISDPAASLAGGGLSTSPWVASTDASAETPSFFSSAVTLVPVADMRRGSIHDEPTASPSLCLLGSWGGDRSAALAIPRRRRRARGTACRRSGSCGLELPRPRPRSPRRCRSGTWRGRAG